MADKPVFQPFPSSTKILSRADQMTRRFRIVDDIPSGNAALPTTALPRARHRCGSTTASTDRARAISRTGMIRNAPATGD